ncbi:unnamed protein product [Moneuplotes crassus]|uniref:Uncharacterized protein n=1 Tax=Euplotes crassus TaxID=5936 RepID=A0AAD1UPA7_EUPCR|nr:unnamed protein product [Moneuplotes crassus]
MEKTPSIDRVKKAKSQNRRRRFKLDKNRKFHDQKLFQRDAYGSIRDDSNILPDTKPYLVMEKVSTKREVVQITHLHRSGHRESNFGSEVTSKHHSPEKLKDFHGDLVDLRAHPSSNTTNTPLMQNYNLSDNHNNMKELKLFSRVDSYQPSETVYFSNKMLQRNIKKSPMPALNNPNYSCDYPKDDSRIRNQVGISPPESKGRPKQASHSQPRVQNSFNDDTPSTDLINRRMKRADLSSWGGIDYKNNDNCAPEGQYHTNSKPRHQQITKNSKFNCGNVKIKPISNKMKLISTNAVNIFLDKDGVIKPLFNASEAAIDNNGKFHSPKSRGIWNQFENDHSFTNAIQTQANYFPNKEEMSLKKVSKSNSYSPSKKKLNKLRKKVMLKNKDDQFFYERSSTMIAEAHQPKDSSFSVIPTGKNKKTEKLLLEQKDNHNKGISPLGQFKRRAQTGTNNSSVQGTHNYKSKVKKRLKFTMKNNKAINSKAKSKDIPCDLNFKVQGISGFLKTSNELYNEGKSPSNVLDDASKIIITKPLNATRNDANGNIQNFYQQEGSKNQMSKSCMQYASPSYNKEDFYPNISSSNNEMKSNADTLNNSNTYMGEHSYSPEKRSLLEGRYLQPPLMEKGSSSKTASELPDMSHTRRMKMNSQNSNVSVAEDGMALPYFSEPSNRMKSNNNMKRSRCTIITKCDGPKVCKTKQTKRICMRRRAEMVEKPILIINFHGVLGCLRKSNSNIEDLCKARKYYQKTQEEDVFIRQAAGKNLKSLMGSFQIVLFINKYAKRHDPLINIIESKVGDVFDAIYTRCSYKNDNRVIDYSQIYEDFCVSTEDIDDRVAVLCPINMETEEVRDRKREELLFIDDTQNYCYKNIIAECIPMNSNAYKNPLSILFASIRNDVFGGQEGSQFNPKGNNNKIMTFARLTKFLNIMMNAFEEEASKSSTKSDGPDIDEFSFIKGFKALQKLITKSNITTLKCALFSTNKISKAVNRQKAKEDRVLKFRSEKKKTYKTQLQREEIHKKFIEYNFHLAKTNSYINLKSQNVHTSRHVNQYYNDFYYEQIEQEEEDIEESQDINRNLGNLLGQFQNFKIPDFSTMSTSSTRLYLNRFVALDHVMF